MALGVLRNCMLKSCRRKSGIVAPSFLFLLNHKRHYFEGKYVLESEEKILKLINECDDVEDLLQFSISKKSGLKLLSRRDEIGEYLTLNDPLPILPKQVLTKFYNSVVGPKKNDKGTRSPVNPSLSAEALSNVNKVVGVCCGANRITWSSMSKKDTYVELDGLAGMEFPYKPKHHFLQLLQEVKQIAEGIPKADVYVLEESESRLPTSTSHFSFVIRRTQLVSYLAGLLAARPSDSHIVAVKTVAVSRLFKLLVGNERVSGQVMVKEIMEFHRHLKVKQEIRYNYLNIGEEEREYLSNPFLLNLAFWQFSNLIPQSSQEMNELHLRN